MGRNIKPQDRSTSANRALEKFTNAPWLCFPLNCEAIHEPFLNFSLPLHAGFLCSVNGRSCTNGLENVWGGGRGGWESSECSAYARIAEEAEASSPAQEAILEQALNARFQAEFS